MKKLLCALLCAALLCGCADGPAVTTAPVQTTEPALTDAVTIRLSGGDVEFPADSGVSVTDSGGNTVVCITEPGTYILTGKLAAGRIAVDLGEDAKDDPNAVVTLTLDNADNEEADSGIHLTVNGGTVIAAGNMQICIEDGSQTHAVFTFASRQEPGTYTLKNAKGEVVAAYNAVNAFQYLTLSSPKLAEGTYTLWSGKLQYQGMVGGGMIGGFMEGTEIQRPDWPQDGADVEIPPQPTMPIVTQGTVTPPQGEQPENMPVPPMPGEGTDMPTPPVPEGSENMPMPQPPAGVTPPPGGSRQPGQFVIGVLSTDFPITKGANYFTNICPVE